MYTENNKPDCFFFEVLSAWDSFFLLLWESSYLCSRILNGNVGIHVGYLVGICWEYSMGTLL
jgi:hypothetical protein